MNDNGKQRFEPAMLERPRMTGYRDLEVLLDPDWSPVHERMELALNAATKRNQTIVFLALEAQRHSQRFKTALNRLRSEIENRKAMARQLRQALNAAVNAQRENEELRQKVQKLEDYIVAMGALGG